MTSWADQFNTYEDACIYYGCDTPSQIAAETQYYFEESCIEAQDDMESRGGPNPAFFHRYERTYCYGDIPF